MKSRISFLFVFTIRHISFSTFKAGPNEPPKILNQLPTVKAYTEELRNDIVFNIAIEICHFTALTCQHFSYFMRVCHSKTTCGNTFIIACIYSYAKMMSGRDMHQHNPEAGVCHCSATRKFTLFYICFFLKTSIAFYI